eukprot:985660-Pyramimonas_sp.AAC.1
MGALRSRAGCCASASGSPGEGWKATRGNGSVLGTRTAWRRQKSSAMFLVTEFWGDWPTTGASLASEKYSGNIG